jgi:hypothetical protein
MRGRAWWKAHAKVGPAGTRVGATMLLLGASWLSEGGALSRVEAAAARAGCQAAEGTRLFTRTHTRVLFRRAEAI